MLIAYVHTLWLLALRIVCCNTARATFNESLPAHELPTVPATAKERTAEQGIAEQWGQLARCTRPGRRTVVHLSDEPSGTLMSGQWCIYVHWPLWSVVYLHGLHGQSLNCSDCLCM